MAWCRASAGTIHRLLGKAAGKAGKTDQQLPSRQCLVHHRAAKLGARDVT
jgi:phosphoribosyl-dephospho-CoA transferase